MSKHPDNRILCESRSPQPVREWVSAPGLLESILASASESLPSGLSVERSNNGEVCRDSKGQVIWEKTTDGRKLYPAKVGQADKKNQNGRIYPRQVWQDQIDRLKPVLLEQGVLIGALDHLLWIAGGNFRDTCVIWRDLWMDSDGGVFAKYEIIETSCGKDLKAMKDAGVSIGWSTFGYGTAHEPGDVERRQYGLSEDEDVVIMDRNYILKKIDAVDDPSVADARDTKESHQKALERNQRLGDKDTNSNTETVAMKDLKELKEKHPELYAQHESAVRAVELQVEKLAESFNAILPNLRSVSGVEIPEREVLPAETSERIASLEAEVGKRDAKIGELAGQLESLQQKLNQYEAEKANALRRSRVKEKLDSLLENNGYAAGVLALAADKLDDPSFTEEHVDAFVKKAISAFEAAGVRPKGAIDTGVKGRDLSDDELDVGVHTEGVGDVDDIEIPESLAQYGKRK